MVTWDVATLRDKMGFYIRSCKVEDAEGKYPPIEIVRDSCYAKVVSAQPIGDARVSDKFVWHQSQFTYRSFSYTKNSIGKQRMTCAVEFCPVINGTA